MCPDLQNMFTLFTVWHRDIIQTIFTDSSQIRTPCLVARPHCRTMRNIFNKRLYTVNERERYLINAS